MSYRELLEVISTPWASVYDIMKIANCGRDAATQIRNEIENNIKKEGKKLPVSRKIIVPMRKLLEYLQLDIDYIIQMAEIEKRLQINRI